MPASEGQRVDDDGIIANRSDAEFSSPPQMVPFFQPFGEGIPSPKFTDSVSLDDLLLFYPFDEITNIVDKSLTIFHSVSSHRLWLLYIINIMRMTKIQDLFLSLENPLISHNQCSLISNTLIFMKHIEKRN